MATKTNELTFGQVDFNALDADEIERLSVALRSDYNPKADTAYGKRLRLTQIFKRHKFDTVADADKFIAEQDAKKFDGIPENIQELDRDTLADYARRAGLKSDISKYPEGEEYKLMKRLNKKMTDENWTLEDVALRQPSSGHRGASIPILMDWNKLDTTAPNGVSETFVKIANHLKSLDPDNAQVGRAALNRPYGFVRILGTSISIRLPAAYAVSEDDE